MNKAVKTVSFIAAATMLAKIMGLARDMILAKSYGADNLLDAYMAASKIPLLFFDFTLGAAIVSTFIPVFNRFLQKDEKEKAIEFSNSFINLVLIISAVFCVIGILFPNLLINITASGFPPERKLLTSKLLIIMLPTVIFTSLAYSFVGILQSYGEFNIPAIISVVSNGAVIIYLLFFNKYFGIYGLAVSMLIGWSLQVFIQIPSLIKKKYRYKPVLKINDQGIKDVFILALPILISSWLQPICVLVNTNFASYLQTGSVSALDLANRFYIIVVGVFVFAITNYIFPSLSKMSGGGDTKTFSDIMRKSLYSMIIIIAPIAAGMMLLSRPIITILYASKKFDETSIILTSTALFYYSIGMLGYGTNEVLNKCFYAMKDGKTPMISSVFGIVSAVLLSFTFTKVLHFKIGGLALSASISAIIVACILIYRMNKKTKAIINKETLVFILKIAVSVLIMITAAYTVKKLVSPYGTWITLIAPAITGIIVYLPMLLLFKMNLYFKEGNEN